MQYNIDTGTFQVVMESADINAVVGESARIEVGEAINYIQSGAQEIAEAVQEEIASFDSNAQEKTSEFNANYTEKKALIDAQVDIAEEQANIATSQAQTATVQAGIATTKAGEATTSASNASLSETNASQSATTATTQAGIATTKAGEASTSASNALASETSASNSAISASNSANLAKQWAIGDPSEPAGNSAKYWAEQSAGALSGLTTRVSTIEGKIPSSASSSNQLVDKNYVDTEDNNLQTQIDAIVSSSDVFDIVGTYAELQAYDITTVPVNDIIKVLVDSTHSGAATYYRCIETAGVKSWSYIGSEGAYYTKGEADSKFSTIPATGSSLDYTGTTLSLENAQGTVLSSVTIKSTPDLDNKSITLNGSSQLQTVGVINSRDSSIAVKTWTGTKAQYDAIVTKDPNTLYNITDDTDVSLTILEALYPVGSVYITTANTCPLSALISGSTWTQETCRQLVEKKEPTDNDPSWYNLYSDGWCDQGGFLSLTTADVNTPIDFIKTFADTNYTIVTTLRNNNTNAGFVNVDNTSGMTTSGTYVRIVHKSNSGCSPLGVFWQACGYTSTTTSHKQFRRTA